MSGKKLVLSLFSPHMNIEHRNALGWLSVVLRYIEREYAKGRIPENSIPGGIDTSGKVRWKISPDRVEFLFIPTDNDVYLLWQHIMFVDEAEKILRCPSMDGLASADMIRTKNTIFVSSFHRSTFDKSTIIPFREIDGEIFEERYYEVERCCLSKKDAPPFKDIFPPSKRKPKKQLNGNPIQAGSLYYAACDKTSWDHREPDYLSFFQPASLVSPFFFSVGGTSHRVRVIFDVTDLIKFSDIMYEFSQNAPHKGISGVMKSKDFSCISSVDEAAMRVFYNQGIRTALHYAKDITQAVDTITVQVFKIEAFKTKGLQCLNDRYKIPIGDLVNDKISDMYSLICDQFPLNRMDKRKKTSPISNIKKQLKKFGITLKGKYPKEIRTSFIATETNRIRGLFISNMINNRNLWEGFHTLSSSEMGVGKDKTKKSQKCYCRKGIKAMKTAILESKQLDENYKTFIRTIESAIGKRTAEEFKKQKERGGPIDAQKKRVFLEIDKIKASWVRKIKANPTVVGIKNLIFLDILDKCRYPKEDGEAIWNLVDSDPSSMQALLALTIAGYGSKKKDDKKDDKEDEKDPGQIKNETVQEDVSECDPVC